MLRKLYTAAISGTFIFGTFFLVFVTFIGFRLLTPQALYSNSLVLGAATQKPFYLSPLSPKSAILSNISSTLATSQNGVSSFSLEILPLQENTYTLPVFQATNSNQTPQSYTLNTNVSPLPKSLELSIIIDGITVSLINKNESLSPTVTIDPESISTAIIQITATEPIRFPFSITLSVNPQ